MAGHVKALPPADSCAYKCTEPNYEKAQVWASKMGPVYEPYICLKSEDNPHYHFRDKTYVPSQTKN